VSCACAVNGNIASVQRVDSSAVFMAFPVGSFRKVNT
jgi:hypothetical protein